LRILIIEDEIIAADRIKDMILSYDPSIEIISTLDSVIDAVNFLSKRKTEVDLIFMDIQLSDGICFEIFEEIEIDCPILFTTAYDEYTLKAFKVNSVDYLLKPVEAKEFHESMERFKKLHYNKSSINYDTESFIKTLKTSSDSFKYRFLIKTPLGFVPIIVSNIAYFYSEDKLTFLITWDKKKHIIDLSLEELSLKLDPKEFFKISRNFIVNHKSIKQIHSYYNNRLKLNLNPPIEKDVFVSRSNVKNFKSWIDN
jgi:DNA-binding LytR/AlgR family response regulator